MWLHRRGKNRQGAGRRAFGGGCEGGARAACSGDPGRCTRRARGGGAGRGGKMRVRRDRAAARGGRQPPANQGTPSSIESPSIAVLKRTSAPRGSRAARRARGRSRRQRSQPRPVARGGERSPQGRRAAPVSGWTRTWTWTGRAWSTGRSGGVRGRFEGVDARARTARAPSQPPHPTPRRPRCMRACPRCASRAAAGMQGGARGGLGCAPTRQHAALPTATLAPRSPTHPASDEGGERAARHVAGGGRRWRRGGV